MILEHLKTEFAKRSEKNPSYSLRAFARSLKLDSSTLSALLSGKRALSYKTALKLVGELDLPLEEQKTLLLNSMMLNAKQEPNGFTELEENEFEMIAGWEHYAILSLLELDGFKATISAVSQRLNIPIGVTIRAVGRLEALGAVKKTNHTIQSTRKQLAIKTKASAALRRANREYIEKAIYSIEKHDPEDRDITGITMAIEKKKIPEARKRIQEFRRSLCKYLESGKKDEVYRLNVQLFPIKK